MLRMLIAIIMSCINGIVDMFRPTLTESHWANRELLLQDRMHGISEREIIRNAEKGKYYMPSFAYPTPHLEKDGSHKVSIENYDLYKADFRTYGAVEVSKRVKQGRYNLTAEEYKTAQLKGERDWLIAMRTRSPQQEKRIKELELILVLSRFDFTNTEAAKQWQQAHNAEKEYLQSKRSCGK